MTKCTSNCTSGKCTNLGAPLPPHPASSALRLFFTPVDCCRLPHMHREQRRRDLEPRRMLPLRKRSRLLRVGQQWLMLVVVRCVPGLWFVFVCCCVHASSAHYVLFAVRWTVVRPDHEQSTSGKQGFILFYAPLTQHFTSFEVMRPHNICMMEGTSNRRRQRKVNHGGVTWGIKSAKVVCMLWWVGNIPTLETQEKVTDRHSELFR